jgi:hypothetical protein
MGKRCTEHTKRRRKREVWERSVRTAQRRAQERPIRRVMENSTAQCRQTELHAKRRDIKGENKGTSRQAEKKLRKTKRKR